MYTKIYIMTLALLALLIIPARGDEGMWPLSELHKLNLKAKGLEIEATDIYNPGKSGLIDAVVIVGRCTGSFVSPRGLIFTNYHCAFRVAQLASDKDHNYIDNGVSARSALEEIPAKGYSVRISESYRDVSTEVLSSLQPGMSYIERTKAIERRIKEIVRDTEKKHPGKRAVVSEMFIGKSYTLFIYDYLKDVRLVYLPPKCIGKFGGEIDNWMWPRHTGDFAFMRAYVAPDGSPASYSPDNVPYRPRKYLQVEPRGIDEEDFAFLLGYPGHTYRHRSSHYLAYEQQVRLPYVASLYHRQIGIMKKMGKTAPQIAMKHMARISSLSNVEKNYRGKLNGIKRISLVDRKKGEEAALQFFIEQDKGRREKYATVLSDIGKIYDEIRETSDRDLLLDYLLSSCNMLKFAYTAYQASLERPKPDIERKSAYMDRNFARTRERLLLFLKDYYQPTDKILLKEMLLCATHLPKEQRIPAVDKLIGSENPEKAIDEFIESAYARSKLCDRKSLSRSLAVTTEELQRISDPFIGLAIELYPTYRKLGNARDRRSGALAKLHAKLSDIKREFLGADFIPDANRTLRLTYGRIRGYSPEDAVYCAPRTTIAGIIEKDTGKAPFIVPQKLKKLHKARDFGKFECEELNDVPVCILYDADTTGGNSGSPILNAYGRLVGINFDRAWEATINDYRWNKDYSRSIGVDIRYVLWILQKFAGAEYLLEEMGVK